jgi:aryl-alcohol dehydrogenase-like predicted oxidoreductase
VESDLEGSGYTLVEAALKFVLAHPAVSVTIPGMRNIRQVEANLAVCDLPEMPKALLQTLQKHNWRRAFWYEGR